MIELRLLNKKGLEDFINDTAFDQMPALPITRHRAQSHLQNPRASETDILLILAYKQNKLAGYLGILPDKLYAPEPVRFGWLSCFWVDAATRGGGIGSRLVEKALELWENKILVTEFAPLSKVIYDRTQAFRHSFTRRGIRLYVRLDLQTILPPKKPLFQKLKPLLKTTDAAANLALDLKHAFADAAAVHLKTAWVSAVDAEAAAFIDSMQPKQLFKRGQAELNWFLQFPWVLSSPENDIDSQRYYFSATDKTFEYHCLKVWNQQEELVAFLIFSKRNQTLKLPYCYMREGAAADVVKIITRQILTWKISTFTTYHPELTAHLRDNPSIGLHKKEMKREYLVSNPLYPLLSHDNFDVQDGDGDCVFT